MNKKWEGDVPSKEDSYVVRKYYEIYNKPFKDFTAEDLRYAIIQKDYIEYIIPFALDMLEKDPFPETIYGKTAFFESILLLPMDFWKENKRFKIIIVNIINDVLSRSEIEKLSEIDKYFIIDLINNFKINI